MGGAAAGENFGEGFAAAEDVGLHLAERGAKFLGDRVVGQVLEVEEHERHALVVGQLVEGALEGLL